MQVVHDVRCQVRPGGRGPPLVLRLATLPACSCFLQVCGAELGVDVTRSFFRRNAICGECLPPLAGSRPPAADSAAPPYPALPRCAAGLGFLCHALL